MHEQLQAVVSKGPKRIAHPRDHSKVMIKGGWLNVEQLGP